MGTLESIDGEEILRTDAWDVAVIRDPDNENELAKDSEKHPEERHEENKAKMESRKPRE